MERGNLERQKIPGKLFVTISITYFLIEVTFS